MTGREFVKDVFTYDDQQHLQSLVNEYRSKSHVTIHDVEALGRRLHQAGVPVAQAGAIESRARSLNLR